MKDEVSNLKTRVLKRVVDAALKPELLSNDVRGLIAEALLAEKIDASIVGGSWHAWDLQLGPDQVGLPQRVRVQVKNSARTQPWNKDGPFTKLKWTIAAKPAPTHLAKSNVPCEDFGFLCDIVIFCGHVSEDWTTADHHDPSQWQFWLISAPDLLQLLTVGTMPTERTAWDITPDKLKSWGIQALGYDQLSQDVVRRAARTTSSVPPG